MATIEEVLDQLHPPIVYLLEKEDARYALTLRDPSVPAEVKRSVGEHELADREQFRVLVLYAINELRRKGSHAALEVLPEWE